MYCSRLDRTARKRAYKQAAFFAECLGQASPLTRLELHIHINNLRPASDGGPPRWITIQVTALSTLTSQNHPYSRAGVHGSYGEPKVIASSGGMNVSEVFNCEFL